MNNINYQNKIDELTKKMITETNMLKKSEHNIELTNVKKKLFNSNNKTIFNKLSEQSADNLEHLQLDQLKLDQLRDLNIKCNNATRIAEQDHYNNDNKGKKSVTRGGVTFIGDTATVKLCGDNKYCIFSTYNILMCVIIILILIIIYLMCRLTSLKINNIKLKNSATNPDITLPISYKL